jgi:hypothetical protein
MQTPRAVPQADLYTTTEKDSLEIGNPLSQNATTPRGVSKSKQGLYLSLKNEKYSTKEIDTS